MLEDHQRAAQIPNEPNVTWHQFLMARFVGGLPEGKAGAFLALAVQRITQQSATHAEIAGLLEYGSGASLPVVVECNGTIDLETRDISIHESTADPKSFVGRVSKNGRVITLHLSSGSGSKSKPVHLVHEETLAQLVADIPAYRSLSVGTEGSKHTP
jgi:hypothetical protein